MKTLTEFFGIQIKMGLDQIQQADRAAKAATLQREQVVQLVLRFAGYAEPA